MTSRTFFDTNILVYAASPHDVRFPAASALIAAGGLISVQVLNELALVMRRKLNLPWPEIVQGLAKVRRVFPDPLPILVATHDQAIAVAARFGFRIYDALLIASALEAECDTLYSEDLQDGQTIAGRLVIRNPFAPI